MNDRMIFLDDYRLPLNTFNYTKHPIYLLDWITVANYDEFINEIKVNGVPKIISFDHDLGDEHYTNNPNIDYSSFKEKTGYDCAKWLIDYCLANFIPFPEQIYIHSWNPAGSINIESLFTTLNKVFGLNIEICRYQLNYR